MEYLYETHMHTSESSNCAQNTAFEQVMVYKKRGYTGIIVTDHFIHGVWKKLPLPWKMKVNHFAAGYEAAKKAGHELGLDVFLGWEFAYYGSDFLTYGLDMQFLLDNPNIDKLSIEEYSAIVRKSGGYIAQAHPYRNRSYIKNKFPVSPHLLDGVETFNALDSIATNTKAYKFAEEHNLPTQAGSDSHTAILKIASGIKLKKKAETIFDIIKAIKSHEVGFILLEGIN